MQALLKEIINFYPAVNPATGDDMKTVIYGGIIAVALVLFISISLIKRSKK